MPVALQLSCDFVAVTLYPWQQAEHVLQDHLGVMEIPAVRSELLDSLALLDNAPLCLLDVKLGGLEVGGGVHP